nr:uncharacterized protein LOC109185082 [Ipomoea trifida]
MAAATSGYREFSIAAVGGRRKTGTCWPKLYLAAGDAMMPSLPLAWISLRCRNAGEGRTLLAGWYALPTFLRHVAWREEEKGRREGPFPSLLHTVAAAHLYYRKQRKTAGFSVGCCRVARGRTEAGEGMAAATSGYREFSIAAVGGRRKTGTCWPKLYLAAGDAMMPSLPLAWSGCRRSVVQWAQKVKDIWTPKSDSQLINIYYLTVKMFNQFYGLRQYNPGATTEDIDQEVERSFASWFRDYVYNPVNNVCNQALIDLACGPLMQATTYNGYVVNGFKFQTEQHCIRKSTNNFGVSIKGTSLSHGESLFFGTLKEIVEVEYPNIPLKKVVLFNCEWFDPTPNTGTKLNFDSGLIEVHSRKRYRPTTL